MNTFPPPIIDPDVIDPDVIETTGREVKPRTGKFAALVIVLTLGIAGLIAAAVVVATKSSDVTLTGSAVGMKIIQPEPKLVNVQYSMTIEGDTCSDVRSGFGYDDIPFGEVEVFDGSQHMLGFGILDGGSSSVSAGDCYFFASFTVPPTTDGLYRITVGNNNRGFLNYNSDDVRGGALFADAVLGQ